MVNKAITEFVKMSLKMYKLIVLNFLLKLKAMVNSFVINVITIMYFKIWSVITILVLIL